MNRYVQFEPEGELRGDRTDRVFVYGTLLPEPSDTDDRAWVEDAVRGRLYDLGPYPGLVDLDDPTAGWISGCVRAVSPELLNGLLDEYEGVSEGLFARTRTVTRNGASVWIYVYNRPLDREARGFLESWEGARGRWPSKDSSIKETRDVRNTPGNRDGRR